MEHHKRQHLLVNAMVHTKTDVRLRLCGPGLSPAYVSKMREIVQQKGLENRVTIDWRWISEDEKTDFLENALASTYVPFDEDSYGYPTIEAAHARRSTVTVDDSGGVLEFVQDGINGFVVRPEPAALGIAFDRLYMDRGLARRMGEAAADRVTDLGIDWDTVIARLLS
jgi:glycosyltransferase involved in cell wall biosynthesis